MLSPRIKINVDLGFFQRWFGGLRKRAGDLTPVTSTAVDTIVVEFLKRQFDSQGTEGGNGWAPWSASTRQARMRKGTAGSGIGRDTDRMWSSLVTSPSSEGVVIANANSYSRWSTVPYLKFFHKGRKYQPARPVIPNPLPPSLIDQIQRTIGYYVKTGRVEVNAPTTNIGVSVSVSGVD